MRVAIGTDHAGFELKERLKRELEALGHEVDDLGTDSTDPVDYPDFCFPVGERVARGEQPDRHRWLTAVPQAAATRTR